LSVLEDEGAVLLTEFAAQPGWNPRSESAWRNDGMLRNYGAGGDDAALADAAIVQDGGSHADDAHILDHAAVNGGVVADGDPVAHDDRMEVALAMEDGAVLDIGVGADADGVDVTAQDGVHPHRRALTEYDVAEDLGGGVDVATCRDCWRMALIASEHGNLCGDLFLRV
jgi:hypothetical protein